MVSVPRELTQMAADAIDDLLADGVSAVSAAAWVDIPQKLRALLAQPAEQHQDEPVGYQVRTMTDRPGSQWTPWRECCDTTRAMHSHEVGRFNRFGIMREIRPVYTHAVLGEAERLTEQLEVANQAIAYAARQAEEKQKVTDALMADAKHFRGERYTLRVQLANRDELIDRLRTIGARNVFHVNNGSCPDEVEGHTARDNDCPACQALMDADVLLGKP
ncbi:hypothetical protein CLJ08_01160 [Pseudomonas mosselii]|nr:hypothetical protein CLJ08_01160 [Pseudomonas mosselii]